MSVLIYADHSGGGEARVARPAKEEAPIVTAHEITIGGRTLSYTVTTGLMPLCDDRGEKEADIFFMAYTLQDAGPPAQRPVMFSFNGGPGSSSVWLHLGALGPKRVRMLDDGGLPPPPYQLVPNEATWLEHTDLVFIDPVGTGFSRPVNEEAGKKFWNLQGDIESVAEFIRMYLTRYQRWTSPLFLVGESYGTTRAAGLAGELIERGIALNGIVLVSAILNFQTAHFAPGNDLPYMLFLPSYTATAWYHRKLPDALLQDLPRTLEEVEHWAVTEYNRILIQGDTLGAQQRASAVEMLARYTGLSAAFIDNCHLRVTVPHFCKELLRAEKRTVGRLDSRFRGMDETHVTQEPEYDPSLAAIRPPYTAMFNAYVRGELGYVTDATYYILGGGIKSPWKYVEDMGYADTSAALRSALAKNPYMRLFVASGYFDLATPYFATEYTLAHMGLDPGLRGNIRTAEYPAGHMMYIEIESLNRLKQDVAVFLREAIPGGA
ncbi:MAG: hypothetical protein RMJ43_09105 [Chloroherpetonaceae bacterium]|nr:hypothetical protein [Chthonomonadaceae bacterium]MDW8207980.1 hypothetical protein [Chloroherpetonaceae bacterium]